MAGMGTEPQEAEPLGTEPQEAEPLGTEPLGTEPLASRPTGLSEPGGRTSWPPRSGAPAVAGLESHGIIAYMASKDMRTRAASGIAAFAAGFIARKAIAFGWTRLTGKPPPDEPEDPEVALIEAIGFATVAGVGMEIARLLATRATIKRLTPTHADSSGPG